MSVLARYLASDEPLADILTDRVGVAKRALVADMAGITMLVAGEPTTVVFTDDEAPEIDQHHAAAGADRAWRHCGRTRW